MRNRCETREQEVRRLANATRFQPGVAVKYLVATKPKDPRFMNVLVLAQLLGWMVLDQAQVNGKRAQVPRAVVRLRHA
jgi:hypothetical protein